MSPARASHGSRCPLIVSLSRPGKGGGRGGVGSSALSLSAYGGAREVLASSLRGATRRSNPASRASRWIASLPLAMTHETSFSRRRRCVRALPTTTTPRKVAPTNKGGEAPKGACQHVPRNTGALPMLGRGCAPVSLTRPPSGATPRLSSRTVRSLTQLRAMLPGTWTAHDPHIREARVA
jgi:hypothetical protein